MVGVRVLAFVFEWVWRNRFGRLGLGMGSPCIGGVVGGFLLLGGPGLIGSASAQSPTPAPTEVYVSPNAEEGGNFGASVAGIGDVNADGVEDVLVGAPNESVGSVDKAGRAYVFSGADGQLLQTLTAEAPSAEDRFGNPVADVGDTNGDGIPDLLVGAGGPVRQGRVVLISGASGEVLQSLRSPNAAKEGLFGRSIAGVGDVTGDEAADVFVGAIGEGEDRAYLFDGARGEVRYTLSSPTDGHDHFGRGTVVGDLDGDENKDLLLGASTTRVNGKDEKGRAYLFEGAGGTRLGTLESPNVDQDGHFGYLVAGAGDVNADGTPDVVVGSVRGPEEGGRLYLFSGTDGDVLHEIVPPSPEEDGHFGYSSANVGDANGDGTPELLLGTRVPATDEAQQGRAYLYGTEKGRLVDTLTSPASQVDGRFGATVAGGTAAPSPDAGAFFVGAPGEQVEGCPSAGRVYRFSTP